MYTRTHRKNLNTVLTIPKDEKEEPEEVKTKAKEKGIGTEKTKKRNKSLKEFMDSIKGGLIELFKEEGDEQLK